MAKIHRFTDRILLEQALSEAIISLLDHAVRVRGQASMAVSGGSTPQALFDRLSLQALPWKQVNITLSDERCVAPEADASNARLVRAHLLQNRAAAATFVPLAHLPEPASEHNLQTILDAYQRTQMQPLDLGLLGMGLDGHTASLFPCADNIADLLSPDNRDTLALVRPRHAHFTRITWTRAALAKSRALILHITGEDKWQVLQKALDDGEETALPVRAFLKANSPPLEVYWAP